MFRVTLFYLYVVFYYNATAVLSVEPKVKMTVESLDAIVVGSGLAGLTASLNILDRGE
jgi:heterodisulfide reductase subunit A-like polyferredoxin